MNKNEEKGSLQEITKIQDNLSRLRDLLSKEGGQQLAEQLERFASQHSKINPKLEKINAGIEKIINTLSQYQTSFTNKSSSEERPELSELERKILDDPAMKNLQVSFDYLQRPNLKYCLVFLSIFPENAVIRKRPLIYWWIGESLISTEEDGDKIFDELLKLELIIPYGNGKNPFVSKCRIHPWIRYLLISLAKNAKLLDIDSKGVPRFEITNSRRACLVRDDENLSRTEPPNSRTNSSNVSESKKGLTPNICCWPNNSNVGESKNDLMPNNSNASESKNDLRPNICCWPNISNTSESKNDLSLNNSNVSESKNDLEPIESKKDSRFNISNVSEFKTDLKTIFNVNQSYVSFKSKLPGNQKLAVLMLGRWQDLSTHHIEVENEECLKELRTQKHLKYLSLRGISRITALPNSILKLTCLEILDLKACHNLETLPDDISPLKKLTHLDVSECYLLERMPKGLERLTSLQVLKGFVIGNSKKTPCRIGDLRNLEKLKRFSIHIGSEAVIQPGEFQKLEGLKTVTHLKISWGTHKKQIVNESFSFPPKLNKLDFEGFPHSTPPDWFSPSKLKELKKLYIKGGKLESLEHKGDDATWKVEILRLHYLKNLKFDKEKLKSLFPSLRYVQEFSMDKGKIKPSEWSEKDLK